MIHIHNPFGHLDLQGSKQAELRAAAVRKVAQRRTGVRELRVEAVPFAPAQSLPVSRPPALKRGRAQAAQPKTPPELGAPVAPPEVCVLDPPEPEPPEPEPPEPEHQPEAVPSEKVKAKPSSIKPPEPEAEVWQPEITSPETFDMTSEGAPEMELPPPEEPVAPPVAPQPSPVSAKPKLAPAVPKVVPPPKRPHMQNQAQPIRQMKPQLLPMRPMKPQPLPIGQVRPRPLPIGQVSRPWGVPKPRPLVPSVETQGSPPPRAPSIRKAKPSSVSQLEGLVQPTETPDAPGEGPLSQAESKEAPVEALRVATPKAGLFFWQNMFG